MRSLQRLDPHHVEEPADEQRWVGSHSRPAHPFGGGVGMLDPLPRARLIGKLLQDQNLVRIVESLASASGPEVTRGTGWGSAVTGDGEWPPPPGADPSATSQAEPGQQVLTGANGSLRRRRTARGRRDGVGKRGCHAGRSRHDVW